MRRRKTSKRKFMPPSLNFCFIFFAAYYGGVSEYFVTFSYDLLCLLHVRYNNLSKKICVQSCLKRLDGAIINLRCEFRLAGQRHYANID
jgi:hypothetical protein